MQNQANSRAIVLIILTVSVCIILIISVLNLQVLDDKYKESSDSNSQRVTISHPSRGLIIDRNGKIIVANESCFDVYVVPSQLTKFDTALLCQVLDLPKTDLLNGIQKARRYSKRLASKIVKNVSIENHAKFQEILYQFPGFSSRPRTRRVYYEPVSGHVLGYVGEVDKETMAADEFYDNGDFIGYSGVEKFYEKQLRGKKGRKILMVDVHNIVQGSYQGGKFDTPSEKGQDIQLTLDVELQKYVERLMKFKRGAVIALEPQTGEILSMVSAPNFTPQNLTGRTRTQTIQQLTQNEHNVLFNRVLMAKYPPGSTFKPLNALISLQERAINVSSKLTCSWGYHSGSFHLKCHHNRAMPLQESIAKSCNAFFCYSMQEMVNRNKQYQKNYHTWVEHLNKFGLGGALGVDFDNELTGYIPDTSFFNKLYGQKGWKASTIISLAIGQGELSFTPIQMANLTAAIANRGYYITPHVVKQIGTNEQIEAKYRQRKQAGVSEAYFYPVIEGMHRVTTEGTARGSRIPNLNFCGKTGTAQNPHGEDHSIFIAFAPKENPQIALAVYIENGGQGSRWAAPTASLIIEKYLTGTVKRTWVENRILNANLLNVQKAEPAAQSRPALPVTVSTPTTVR